MTLLLSYKLLLWEGVTMISRYYAVKELLENGINSLPITTEQIETILNSKGFKIINYDISYKKHTEILEGLGVLSLASRTKAFTYVHKKEKFVFIKMNVSANEKRLLLAHELGHISLRHVSNNTVVGYRPGGLIDEGQEDEANAFALDFLAPVCVLNRKHINTSQKISGFTLLDEKRSRLVEDEVQNYKKTTEFELELCKRFETSEKSKKLYYKSIAFIAVILLVSFSLLFMYYTLTVNKNGAYVNTTEQPVTTVFPETSGYSDYVVVTASGEKYHYPKCYHVTGKATITQMSIEQAQNAGYEPCRDCFPELY